MAHHGILGQKWGVRNYQNEDGSLTAAGKERYYTQAGDQPESFRSRKKRSTEAAKYEEKADRYRYKAYKAKTDEKHDKLNAKADELGNHAAKLRGGLSENEIALGKSQHRLNKTATSAAIAGGILGGATGAAGSYALTQVLNKHTNKSYKSIERAAKADYQRYVDKLLTDNKKLSGVDFDGVSYDPKMQYEVEKRLKNEMTSF